MKMAKGKHRKSMLENALCLTFSFDSSSHEIDERPYATKRSTISHHHHHRSFVSSSNNNNNIRRDKDRGFSACKYTKFIGNQSESLFYSQIFENVDRIKILTMIGKMLKMFVELKNEKFRFDSIEFRC
jgi:hypothetical protein